MLKNYFALFVISFFFQCSQKEIDKPSTADAIYDNSTNKLWAHRVYKTKEANVLLDEFIGLETDVIYDTSRNKFDIRHNLTDSFQNRSLEDFLKNISALKDHYYWIDFKNLNSRTVKNALLRLNYLSETYAIKDKIIIESPNCDELGILSKSGYFVSYWIPHNLKDWNETEFLIRENLRRNKINALSANYEIYPFLKKHFPDANIHLWTNGLMTEQDKEKIRKLHTYQHIKVILVDYKDNFIQK